MNTAEYIEGIGSIVINLQSLEYALRGYLYETETPPHHPLVHGQAIDTHPLHATLPENALTNYWSLGQLIEHYNAKVKVKYPDLQVEADLVTLRDALAHGRVSAPVDSDIFSIIKFSRPKNNEVTVEYRQQMTAEWLTREKRRVHSNLMKVVAAITNHQNQR